MTQYARSVLPVFVLLALLMPVRCGKDGPTGPQPPVPARITATGESAPETVGISIQTTDSDKSVLIALYNATNGPNWSNNRFWLSEVSLNDWHGVKTGEDGRVVELSLTQNNLEGSIPAVLNQLDQLRTLSFFDNKLHGSIPPELGQLSNLETLWLAGNNLSGTIPPELGQLTNLWQFGLASNQLTGIIPPEFSNLTNVSILHLGNNDLCIPDSPDLKLWLAGIREKDTVPLCSDVEIEALTAFYNSTGGADWTNSVNWLQDAPLEDWYGVTTDESGRIQSLNLADNNLHGTLPLEIGTLANLKTLNLSINEGLTGPLPVKLTGLGLESLVLDGTNLCAPKDADFQDWLTDIPHRSVANCVAQHTETLFALVGLYNATNGASWTNNANWLSQAPLATWYGVATDAEGRVTELSLGNNNLIGTLPADLGTLEELNKLDLSGNAGLLGPLPESLTSLSVESLDLSGTSLCAPSTSGFRSWLEGIPESKDIDGCLDVHPDWEPLVALYTETNGRNWNNNTNWLSAKPLDQWYGVTTNTEGRVISLQLEWNDILGPIPAELVRLEELETLNLRGNELSGAIPPELGNLENLRELTLSWCWVSGTIPPEFGRLTNLELLDLSFNGSTLKSVLPRELGRLVKLRRLALSGNAFDGSIPRELGQLVALEYLFLGYNSLSGPVPLELGQLTSLRGLLLNNNEFTGSIPSSLSQLTELEYLNLSRNRLSGPIPVEALGRLTRLTELELNGNEFSGPVPGELNRMTSLQSLDLANNRLEDSVPSELGDLTGLKELMLAGNSEMTGSLPVELTNLHLETLMLGDTGLCAPRDTEFQTWLRSIQNSRVVPCSIPVRATAYLTQATQSLDHPVPLVAGEDALLRVFIRSEEETGVNMPPCSGHVLSRRQNRIYGRCTGKCPICPRFIQ